MVYLQQHLQKYPEMQLTDIVKLLFQGTMGPAHIFVDIEQAQTFMLTELSKIHRDCHDIVEEISDDYVRVYLYPYFQKYHNFDTLAVAFANSAKQQGDIEVFKQAVRSIITPQNKKQLEDFLAGGRYSVSHSEHYKKLYDPHYRVISKKYLDDALCTKENKC